MNTRQQGELICVDCPCKSEKIYLVCLFSLCVWLQSRCSKHLQTARFNLICKIKTKNTEQLWWKAQQKMTHWIKKKKTKKSWWFKNTEAVKRLSIRSLRLQRLCLHNWQCLFKTRIQYRGSELANTRFDISTNYCINFRNKHCTIHCHLAN